VRQISVRGHYPKIPRMLRFSPATLPKKLNHLEAHVLQESNAKNLLGRSILCATEACMQLTLRLLFYFLKTQLGSLRSRQLGIPACSATAPETSTVLR